MIRCSWLLLFAQIAFSQDLNSRLTQLEKELKTTSPAEIIQRLRSVCGVANLARCEDWGLQVGAALQEKEDNASLEREIAIFDALRDLRHQANGTDSENAAVLVKLGETYFLKGNYTEAEPLFRRALEIMKLQSIENGSTADALDGLASVLEARADYAKSIELYQRALGIRETIFGTNSPEIAHSFLNLADVYETIGSLKQAETLGRQALAILEKADPTSAKTAVALNNLAELYHTQGRFAEAERMYQRALAIMEKLSGESPDTATALNNLASLYDNEGLYEKAEPLWLRALKILESARGLEHPDTAGVMSNLGTLYYNRGDYKKAEENYQHALEIREKILPPDHPDTAASMDNLAQAWVMLGEYAKAEPMYLRALAIREKRLGPAHADTARTLNNLGVLYVSLGNYPQAERMLTRSVEILEKALPPNHPTTADSINNLAWLYRQQGAYAKAEPLLKRVIEMREASQGPNHRDTAVASINLANLYREHKEYAKAEPLCQRAEAILEKALPAGHPDIATALDDLGLVYLEEGAYEKAQPILARALAKKTAALGGDHPGLAPTLNNLAKLHFLQKDFPGAEAYFARSLAIFQKSVGADNPDTISVRIHEARALWEIGKRGEARDQLMEANRCLTRFWSGALVAVEETRRRSLVEKFDDLLPVSLSMAAQLSSDDPAGATKLAALAIMARKGIQSAARQEVFARLQRGKDKQSLALVRQLMANAEQLGRAARLPEPQSRIRMAQLEVEENRIEQELIGKSAAFREWRTPLEPRRITAALPPGTALIDILRFPRLDLATGAVLERDYAAAVYRSGEDPKLVFLGAAKPIDDAVAALRSNVDNIWTTCLPQDHCAEGAQRRLLNDAPFEANLRHTEADCATLYRLTMAKLLPAIQGRKQLLISPDGELAEIPWEILRDGGYLVEKGYRIRYLDSARSIVDPEPASVPRTSPVVIANVDYDGNPLMSGLIPPAEFPGGDTEELPAGISAKWLPLRGGDEILRTLGELHREGKIGPFEKLPYGSEEEVLALRQPVAIFAHTHGFFNARANALSGGLEAGIVLYGANKADQSGHRGRDGWLMAREVMLLHLEGTQLVALFGCDTGLGAEAGEGVQGLRHALAVAGARSTILTLWDVGDLSSARFLNELLVRLASNSRPTIEEALVETRLAFLKGDVHEAGATTASNRWRHPYFWAAATLAGTGGVLNLRLTPENAPRN